MEQHLLVFKEVAETNNITLSAKNLHMSQSSISLQIQSLENEYSGVRFTHPTVSSRKGQVHGQEQWQ